jgi:hypothetical protein
MMTTRRMMTKTTMTRDQTLTAMMVMLTKTGEQRQRVQWRCEAVQSDWSEDS